MDRDKITAVFQAYADHYDTSDIKIKLKIDHTYRVAGFADRIGASVGADRDFCWFLGILHDIARFEQQTRYGTFKDAASVDHAELGADILFREGLIDSFDAGLPGIDNWRSVADTAIRLHNKLTIPEDLDETARLYSTILRDADKVDIFRVLTEPPYDAMKRRIEDRSVSDPSPARDMVMECVKAHRCVSNSIERSAFESLISSCCMGFELQYPESRRMVKEQGYLEKLMNLDLKDAGMKDQLEILKKELDKVFDQIPE